MTTQEIKKEQYRHVAECGGYWNLQEVDDVNNDFNRALIRAFKQENGKAVIGKINLPLRNPHDAEAVEPAVFEEYTGQLIYNFGADFVIPAVDSALEALIREWNTKDGYKKGMKLLNAIIERINNNGGLQLFWT